MYILLLGSLISGGPGGCVTAAKCGNVIETFFCNGRVFAPSVYSMRKAIFVFPSTDRLRPGIGHASCQRPRQKPPRTGFYLYIFACRCVTLGESQQKSIVAQYWRSP